jgi:hypothetical protein
VKFLRTFLVVFLLLAAIGAVSSAWASLHDEETIGVSGQAATLKVSVGAGSEMETGFTLGDDLKPGDCGSAPITIVNEGSIDGEVCAEVVGEVPSYLSLQLDDICGDLLGAGQQTTIYLDWQVLDEDLGTGGQTFDLSVHVSIEQP